MNASVERAPAHGQGLSAAVPPGYKLTEVGVIPEDWELKRLGDVLRVRHGKSQHDVETKDGRFPILASGGEIGRTDTCLYDKPSVLIGRKGTIDKPQYRDEPFWTVDTLFYTEIGCANSPKFIFYKFNLINWRSYNEASGVPSLNASTIENIEIARPPLPEQRAIATVLSDVDALLAKIDHLIAKKRDLKQAAMQQLLTGQTRLPGFSGEWEVKRLGDVGRFSKGMGIKKDEVRADGFPCIRYGEIYTRHNDYVRTFHSYISPSIAAESQRLRKGDLLFAGSGETAEEIGKCVAFLGDAEAYAGGDIVILTPLGQDSLYLGYLMNHSTVVAQKSRMGQGDAVVHISARNLAEIEIRLPLCKEQTAIATILSDMDAELAALQARRDKTRDLKQGMMQALLTGRIRLI